MISICIVFLIDPTRGQCRLHAIFLFYVFVFNLGVTPFHGACGASSFAPICKNYFPDRCLYDTSRSTLDRGWGTRALTARTYNPSPEITVLFSSVV